MTTMTQFKGATAELEAYHVRRAARLEEFAAVEVRQFHTRDRVLPLMMLYTSSHSISLQTDTE